MQFYSVHLPPPYTQEKQKHYEEPNLREPAPQANAPNVTL